jgi:hypothetical protein
MNVDARATQVITTIPQSPTFPSAKSIIERMRTTGTACYGEAPRPDNNTLGCYLESGENVVVSVFVDVEQRNLFLKSRLEKPWMPQTCIFGANWFIGLDYDKIADRLAKVLGGVVVRIDPQDITH